MPRLAARCAAVARTGERPTTMGCALGCVTVLFAVMAAGCATDGGGARPGSAVGDAVRAENCKTGDQRIADRSACLLDDAACYQLINGSWCTGPRGNVCPAGSSALVAGQACPPGSVCFRMSEGLECIAG